MAVNAKTLNETEFFYGHKACAGCGGSLAVRIALKVLGENAIAVLPAGCMSSGIMPLYRPLQVQRQCLRECRQA